MDRHASRRFTPASGAATEPRRGSRRIARAAARHPAPSAHQPGWLAVADPGRCDGRVPRDAADRARPARTPQWRDAGGDAPANRPRGGAFEPVDDRDRAGPGARLWIAAGPGPGAPTLPWDHSARLAGRPTDRAAAGGGCRCCDARPPRPLGRVLAGMGVGCLSPPRPS